VTALVIATAPSIVHAQSYGLAAGSGGAAQFPAPVSIRLDPRDFGILSDFRIGEDLPTSDRNDEWTFEVNRAAPALEAGAIEAGDDALDSQTRLVGALVGRRFTWPKRSFEFLGGIRFLGSDLNAGPGARTRGDDGLLDPVASGRFTFDLSDRWRLGLRGDFTGVGLRSGLKFRAAGLFGYRLNKNRSVLFGYRIFGLDVSEGNHRGVMTLDFRHGGPVLGFDFRF